MACNNTVDFQDQNDLKLSLPRKLILEKYKRRMAGKAQKQQDDTEISSESVSIEDCSKTQNEKSDDHRDLSIKHSPSNEVKRMKYSTFSGLLESESKIQLTRKTIMQEKLFKSLCDSMENQVLNKSQIKETEVNKLFRNNSRRQNNRSKKLSTNKSRNQQDHQEENKSIKLVEPSSSSENSSKLEDNKVFHYKSKVQNNRPKINNNISNKLLVPINSSENVLESSTTTNSAANNVSLLQSKTSSSENIPNIESKSTLHLKQSLMNKQNDAIYYKNHGKMEPMPWSVINFNEDTSSKKGTVKFSKGRFTQESIEKIATTKDGGNKAFLNFVDSSTDSDTVFRVQSNLMQIKKITSPLSKIKTDFDKKSGQNLQVTTQIKEKLTLSQLKSTTNHVMDFIDYPMKQSFSMDKLIDQNILGNKENSSSSISSTSEEKFVEKSKDIQSKDSENILNAPLKENSINTTKQQTDIEYDDDMFNFEKPISNITPLVKEDENSMTNSSVKKLSIEAQEYFIKLKHLHKTQFDSSVDSDDLSFICNSEIDDLSALRGSTFSKYEAVTNKIRNASIENSYRFKQNADTKEKENEKLEVKASHSFNEFIKGEDKKRIIVEEKNLNTIPNEIKKILVEKVEENSNLEFDVDSGLGFKTSNSTKTDSFITTRDDSDSEESYIIFHKHTDSPSSVVIQEINSTPGIEIGHKINITESKNVKIEAPSNYYDYEDIDPDEEFDIVNAQEFGPCAALLNKLKAVRAAQKARATGIINEEDVNAIMEFDKIDELVSDKINNKEGIKAIMELEENDNEMSTLIDKCRSSESTNLTTDKDEPTVAKNDISEKVETDKTRDSGYPLNDCDNAPKICNPTTTKAGVSKRMQKIKDALQKYQKKYKTKDTGEGSVSEKVQEEQQRPIDAQKNQSLRTGLILQRRQILKEILKQKLHLQCKPMLV